jgi:hypothetical protein
MDECVSVCWSMCVHIIDTLHYTHTYTLSLSHTHTHNPYLPHDINISLQKSGAWEIRDDLFELRRHALARTAPLGTPVEHDEVVPSRDHASSWK